MEELWIWPWPEDSTLVPSVWGALAPGARMSQTREGQSFHQVSRPPKVHRSNAQSPLSPQGASGSPESPLCAQPGWQQGPPAPCRAGCQQGGPQLGPGSPSYKRWRYQEVTGVPARQVRSRRLASPPTPPARLWTGQVTPGPCPPLPSHLCYPLSKSWAPSRPRALLPSHSPLCHAPRHSRS